MLKKIFAFVFIVFFVAGTVLHAGVVSAQLTKPFSGTGGAANSVVHQSQPSFQTYYGSDINTYWPILGDRETCEARQDFILNVAPAGCQPSVVRSDLLAEQDVPVFCQIDAFKINPLLDINQIRSMRFSGEYPEQVVDVDFHPARIALRTHDRLLGSPLVNNLGYAVVILKRQPVESKLPEFVNVTLRAQLDYIAGNAFGVGMAEFLLEPVADNSVWEAEKLKQSFWEGRYFVRLEKADSQFADISIYDGDRKIFGRRVAKGEISQEAFLPGLYCRAGLQIAYDGFVSSERKARIEVSSKDGTDVFDVTQGSEFLNGRCNVRRIEFNEDKNGTGIVTGRCRNTDFVLDLKPKTAGLTNGILVDGNLVGPEKIDSGYMITIENSAESRNGYYLFKEDNRLFLVTEQGEVELVSSAGSPAANAPQGDKNWLIILWNEIKNYKEKDTAGEIGIDKELSSDTKKYFEAAVKSYEEVADNYPNQGGIVEGTDKYGEEALRNAIELAHDFGQSTEEERLVEKLLGIYPDSSNIYSPRLEKLKEVDFSNAIESVELDDKAYTIKLLSIDKPSKEATAELIFDDVKLDIALKAREGLRKGNKKVGEVTLDSLKPDQAVITAYCSETIEGQGEVVSSKGEKFSLELAGQGAPDVCGVDARLNKANIAQIAKVRLLPSAKGTQTISEFNINVGIEKRAIELTPDKAREKIEEVNKSIERWEEISENLGDVVSGLKGACFATAGLLSFKNFMSGLNGETLARQEVMSGEHGWRNRCKDMVSQGVYPTLDACYLGEADKINRDVSRTTAALNAVNQKIQEIQSQYTVSTDVFGRSVDTSKLRAVFGRSVDTSKLRADLAEQIRQDYPELVIDMQGKKWVDENGNELDSVGVDKLLTSESVEKGLISTDAMRNFMLNAELKKRGAGTEQELNINSRLKDIAVMVNGNMQTQRQVQSVESDGRYPSVFFASPSSQNDRVAHVVIITTNLREEFGFSNDVTHIAMMNVNPSVVRDATGVEVKSFEQGVYALGLVGDSQRGIYTVKEVSKKDDVVLNAQSVAQFVDTYGIGNIRSIEGVSYRNEIFSNDRVVKYYDTEPYRGMPAVVPFDITNGWYAATRQTLPVFGGIGAFDASGRVTSFWLCNVGDNGRIEFESGFGDDLCQQVNLNTGQPLGFFPGLTEQEARSKVSQAIQAIEEAARKYGNKFITINGERMETDITVGTPGTQCQDFMSPNDCHLLFNVCDPVICPNSRCNFGGKYQVANVAQTGIVGSALLCLPNIREGIAIPVCLTGIQAGIDGFTSIMKNYRSCLEENLETGRLVGVCDQIYSVYLCEFFWGQIAPIANVLLPKIVETAYGQGVRGGGEYLTVMAAWDNMQNSLNYFTQSYGVNSLEAFQARTDGVYGSGAFTSFDFTELGGEFCKSWISAKAPNAFESLIEPDSPPQFHAWFDAKRFTDATLPATSQYKVFYHIYSGKDSGVQFAVYLKDPPESPYYSTAPQVVVDSGFVPRGEFASETKDFTAPEGYQQLCVRINNDEHCGFGQVSTSFAVNYLRDVVVQDELSNKNIRSERECISGSNNPGFLITPNIQAGVEETISPEIYNRGVIRICSTDNPGLGTGPERFVKVGTCDDQSIGCWLDTESVDNALTQSNIDLKEETLEELQKTALENLESDRKFFTSDEAAAEIISLKDAVLSMNNAENVENSAQEILSRIDFVLERTFSVNQAAQLFLIHGEVNEIVAKHFWNLERKEAQDALKQKLIAEGELDASGQTLESDSGQSLEIEKLLECSLANPRWTDTNGNIIREAVDGTVIYPRVDGQNCEGATIVFEIEEVDVFNDNVASVEGIFPSGVWKAHWTYEGDDDLGNDARNYLFIAKVKGTGIQTTGKSNEVAVSRLTGERNGQSIEQCTVLNNPRWLDSNGNIVSSVIEGQQVTMRVDAPGCNGEEVIFEVREDDGVVWDSVEGGLFTAIVENDIVTQTWVSSYMDDFFGNPEYYFVAKVQGRFGSGNSGNLEVLLGSGGEIKIEECTSENLGHCSSESDCLNVGGYWYSNQCNGVPYGIHIANGVETLRDIAFFYCDPDKVASPLQAITLANQGNPEFVNTLNTIGVLEAWPYGFELAIPENCL